MAACGGARLQLHLQLQENGIVMLFLNNLNSWKVKWGWGLDGCARWRKVTVTVTIKVNWEVIVIGIH